MFPTSSPGCPATSALFPPRPEKLCAHRHCIADLIAARPKDENADEALAAALGQCRNAELALRAACKSAPGSTTADTIAIVHDTRIEGEEAGLARRDTH